MRIAITGADGFVGRALATRLMRDARLGDRAIEELLLLDLTFHTARDSAAFVRRITGDIADTEQVREMLSEPLDVLFHLASIPGGAAEQNYELSRRVNLDATLTLLECCKAQHAVGRPPVFIFASTIAVFGELTTAVNEQTATKPLMTYGAQKLIGEILVSDFSRRGWIDGRSLRLPGVLARPPAKTGQASAFLSDLIRELAAGRRFVCPMTAGATTWASSLPCVIDNLVHAACAPATALSGERTFTLPTTHFSMSELVEAIGKAYGTPTQELITYQPDARIEALFGRFPPLETPAAERFGLLRDSNLEQLVQRALSDY